MTRNPIFRTMLLAGFIGAATSPLALAQGWGGHHGGPGGWAVLASLGLNDAQKSQLHAAMKAGFEAAKPYREQLHAIDAQIKSKLAGSGSVTLADVAPLLQQKEQIRAQLEQTRMATILQVRALLTPAQIAQAAATQAKLESLHEQERAALAPPSTGNTAQ